jgi:hypothetical protein
MKRLLSRLSGGPAQRSPSALLVKRQRSDKCAFAATNLHQAAAHKILNSAANTNAADSESLNEAVFRRQVVRRPSGPHRQVFIHAQNAPPAASLGSGNAE